MLYILKSSLHIESSENTIYRNLIIPWARTDIPLRFSIPLRLWLAQEASSMFDDLQVSRCISMAVCADPRPTVEGPIKRS